MKAIIISDMDARALLQSLELTAMRGANHIVREKPQPTVEEIHRAFHYIVTRWLQEQGANVVGR